MKKTLAICLTVILLFSGCLTSCGGNQNEVEAYKQLNTAYYNVSRVAATIEGGWAFAISNKSYSDTELRNSYIKDFAKAIGFSQTVVINAYRELSCSSTSTDYALKYYADSTKGTYGYTDYGKALKEFQQDVQSLDTLFDLIYQVLEDSGVINLTKTNLNTAYELVKEISTKSKHYDDFSEYYAELLTCYNNCMYLSCSYSEFSAMVQDCRNNVSKLRAKLSVAYEN